MDLTRLNPYSPASKAAPAGTYINRHLRSQKTSASRLRAAGWTATAETSETVGSRITATRIVLLGVFAAAARKRTGEVYAVFTGPTPEDQEVVTLPIRLEAGVRQWVENYNEGMYDS